MKKIQELLLKEVIFGVEDGLVSTLGALTGIAIGSQDHNTIILSGVVIIAVESISMGVGSYLSTQSLRDWHSHEIKLEKYRVKHKTISEEKELQEMLLKDGWTKKMAKTISAEAGKNKKLLFKEMLYRELGLTMANKHSSANNAIAMFLAYIVGGLIPLGSYIFLDWQMAIYSSIIITLIALIGLGALIAKITHTNAFRGSLRVFLLGGMAMLMGIGAGWFGRNYLGV